MYGFNQPYIPNGYNNINAGVYTPYMTQNPAIRDVQQIVKVNGLEGAKAYQMAPNSMIALFHESDDIFYIKTTDGAGFPTIKAFRFTPTELESSSGDASKYATRDDLDALRKELNEYVKQYISTDTKAHRNAADETR